MADGYTIKHRDEFEVDGGLRQRDLAAGAQGARHLCFGFNLVEIEPGGQIPEHNHGSSGQVELYVILEGDAMLRLDGEDHPAPAGTFASIEPPTTRTILNQLRRRRSPRC